MYIITILGILGILIIILGIICYNKKQNKKILKEQLKTLKRTQRQYNCIKKSY